MIDNNSLWYDIEANKSNASDNKTSVGSKNGSDLDKDAFLRLLVTQLQYQDPLNPMDNTEFVSQMAQFTALEQMNNLNSTMTNSQAYSMIGRTVYAQVKNENTNTYEEVTGTIDSVTIKSGKAYLNIGDKEISYDDVKEVYSTDTNTSIDRNLVVSQALSLVGKYVQAITFDNDLKPKEFVEGNVDYVKFVGDSPVLSVNGKDVYTHEILSVSDNTLLKGQTISAEVHDTATNTEVDITGKIDNVYIKNESIYLTIGKNDVEIKDISSVLKALSYVGQDIDYTDKSSNQGTDKDLSVSGKVDSVIIRDKECYLVVGEKELLVSKLES